jgi:hypothetical protein
VLHLIRSRAHATGGITATGRPVPHAPAQAHLDSSRHSAQEEQATRQRANAELDTMARDRIPIPALHARSAAKMRRILEQAVALAALVILSRVCATTGFTEMVSRARRVFAIRMPSWFRHAFAEIWIRWFVPATMDLRATVARARSTLPALRVFAPNHG